MAASTNPVNLASPFRQIRLFALFGIVFSQDTSACLPIDTTVSFYTIPSRTCASITERGVLEYEVG